MSPLGLLLALWVELQKVVAIGKASRMIPTWAVLSPLSTFLEFSLQVLLQASRWAAL
jgi:hypothetical protein